MKSAEISFPKPTLFFAQICLFGAIAVLSIVVELLIMRAIINNTDSIHDSQRANIAVTNLANVQRESLLLEIETNRILLDPDGDTAP